MTNLKQPGLLSTAILITITTFLTSYLAFYLLGASTLSVNNSLLAVILTGLIALVMSFFAATLLRRYNYSGYTGPVMVTVIGLVGSIGLVLSYAYMIMFQVVLLAILPITVTSFLGVWSSKKYHNYKSNISID